MPEKYDEISVSQVRELEERVTSDPSAGTEPTQCAQIIPEPTTKKIEPGSEKVCPPFKFFAFCLTINIYLCLGGLQCLDGEHLGYKSPPDELNGPKVHRLENVMTLAPGCHSKFDQLRFLFVATVRLTSPWIGLPH